MKNQTFLSGGSSSFVRERLLTQYRVLFVVLNSDPGTPGKHDSWNWSEDTDLAELILVAEEGTPEADSVTTIMNFRRKPRSMIEAGYALETVAHSIAGPDTFADVADSSGSLVHVSCVRQRHLKKHGLNYPSIFSSSLITRWLHDLLTRDKSGDVIKPLFGASLPLLGMGTKEVRALFAESSSQTPHRVKWGHTMNDAKIVLADDDYGFGVLKAGKTFDTAQNAYANWGGELLIANRPQMRTKRILATLAPDPVLSTAFWACRLPEDLSEAHRQLIVLWLNSTPGLLMFLSASLHKKGELFEFKKSQASRFWIPDLELVPPEEVAACWRVAKDAQFGLYRTDYVFLAEHKGTEAALQNVRHVIDRLFVDTLYAASELDAIYNELSREPIFA